MQFWIPEDKMDDQWAGGCLSKSHQGGRKAGDGDTQWEKEKACFVLFCLISPLLRGDHLAVCNCLLRSYRENGTHIFSEESSGRKGDSNLTERSCCRNGNNDFIAVREILAGYKEKTFMVRVEEYQKQRPAQRCWCPAVEGLNPFVHDWTKLNWAISCLIIDLGS